MEIHAGQLPQPIEPRRHPSHEFTEAVRRRAQEIYELQGRVPGHDLENWLQAEAEVRTRTAQPSVVPGAVLASRAIRRITIKVDHVTYIGEYDPEAAGGYTAGEFAAGAPVRVRFAGNNMLLRRGNGAELRTRIVKKIPCAANLGD